MGRVEGLPLIPVPDKLRGIFSLTLGLRPILGSWSLELLFLFS